MKSAPTGSAASFTCRTGVGLEPTYAAGHFNLGGALLLRGDARGALSSLEEARRLGMPDPRLDTLIEQARARSDTPDGASRNPP